MTQAEFAREKGVSRKTVTQWKRGGYLVMSGNMVDVRRSHEKLLRAGRLKPRPGATQGQPQRSTGGAVDDPKDIPEIAFALANATGCTVIKTAEILLRHFEPESVRPILTELWDHLRRGDLAVMEEDGPPAPPPLRSWAEWDGFALDPVEIWEWEELVAEAAKTAGNNAVKPAALSRR